MKDTTRQLIAAFLAGQAILAERNTERGIDEETWRHRAANMIWSLRRFHGSKKLCQQKLHWHANYLRNPDVIMGYNSV